MKNVIVSLYLSPTIVTNFHDYIKVLKLSCRFGQIFRVQEVVYISYNTGTSALPDIYARCPRARIIYLLT